jgi:hypothetical protein
MKTIVSLLIFISLFCSCQEKKTSNAINPAEDIDEPSMNKDADVSKSIVKEILTSTGKSFKVEERKQSASLSILTITTKGFTNTQEVFEIKDTDPLSQFFTLDLNKDGFEELYLITKATGSGSYERIMAFASNNDLSVTPVYVPKMTEKDLESEGDFMGYMGHDSIYVANKQLYRKFPVYLEGDANCCPTGGNTTLTYQLRAGEAGWVLEAVK